MRDGTHLQNSSQKRMVIEMDRWMKTVVEIKEAPSPRKQFIANATRLSRRRDNKEKSSSDLTYHHAVPEILCGLIIGAGGQFIREIQAKSSASVYLARDKTPVEGMHIFVIRGTLAQVEEAVRLISQKTGSQGTISHQAQKFWLQWIQHAFPELEHQTYFLPAIFLKRVPLTTGTIAGQPVSVLRSSKHQSSSHCSSFSGSDTTFPSCTRPEPQGTEDKRVCKVHVVQGVTNNNHVPDVLDTNPFNFVPGVPQPLPVQDTDIRDDAVLEQVLMALDKLGAKNEEVFFCLSQLRFGMYLGKPCYTAAAAQLPLPSNLPAHLPSSWKQGDFDVLIIHRQYGIITCEIKICGYNFQDLQLSQLDIDKQVTRKLKQAAGQLDKAEAVLRHLVSDIAPGLRITKVIVVPHLTSESIQRAITNDFDLKQDLSRCLGAKPDPADITELILCADQLPISEQPWNIRQEIQKELENWWQRRVTAPGPDPVISSNLDLYKLLLARFCGPATAVTIPCLSHPRLSIKTLDQGVSAIGECFAQINLYPEQIEILHAACPRLFLAGPPGTGKSVMLQLRAAEWIRGGHEVHVLSTWEKSRLASSILYHFLLTVSTQNKNQTEPEHADRVRLHHFDFWRGKDEKKALNYFKELSTKKGCLYIVADEVGPDYSWPDTHFQNFCLKLKEAVPDLHLWAASCTHEVVPPSGWHLEILTRPLRCPPVVVREVEQEKAIFQVGRIQRYEQVWGSTHSEGPPVKTLCHKGHGHSDNGPLQCRQCGTNLARYLKKSLRVGATTARNPSGGTPPFVASPPSLRYKDVLILCVEAAWDTCGLIQGLADEGVPVKVMKESDTDDVATATSDVVWVADVDHVRGLEKKVVVCVGRDYVGQATQVRLHGPSRCSSQLVWLISPHDKPLVENGETQEIHPS
ncbi:uncharacterized protein LOC112568121 isoform X2 [Pomacea canaliculata]|uniref:uncharacterized protein LOC112568121 isoform X2 n=1 Tax=Pomacea canaliculata TaxID=400727 RepID=UPI000D732838|nr:uncharacterized protein LOC112568121 isoform X2 [Pomacea canaliculata]